MKIIKRLDAAIEWMGDVGYWFVMAFALVAVPVMIYLTITE